jgi:hypothetical protein
MNESDPVTMRLCNFNKLFPPVPFLVREPRTDSVAGTLH